MEELMIPASEEVLELVEEKKYAQLRSIFMEMNPQDLAALLTDLPREKTPILFRLLPKELAAETFIEMESDLQEHLIKGFSDAELRDIM
ncbi:MAG: magnesium transporter, partial [Parasporobacterium sp.]|nr:magnesium transporter [Parasporobacterium sp.]